MKYDDIINYSQQKRKNHKEISKWFFGGGGDDDIIFELNKRIKELEEENKLLKESLNQIKPQSDIQKIINQLNENNKKLDEIIKK
jgi:hypothetical protein